jgi:hypothetical protein
LNILALDQSVRRTGWAVAALPERSVLPPRFIGRGWFGAIKPSDPRAQVFAFTEAVRALVIDYEVGALVWEKPSAFAGPRGVNARTLILTRLDEALHQLARQLNVAVLTVAASTWRAKVLGKGGGRLTRDEAKRQAVRYCEWIGIACANDDEAEAVCIALWAAAFGRIEEQARVS